ncbi:MAG: SMP-30/gluconolactonase/LRE family protein [Desulfuromonadales bacterium]|nr:SMP-30/gluconolactonase/LRE family protein [Desulfuromonadales bacterium]
MNVHVKIRCLAKVVQPLLLVTFFVVLLSGCAGKTAGPAGPVFFPPPPDEPHVQFLMGINDSTDIEGKSSKFSMVLTGSEQSGLIKKIGKPYGMAARNGKLYICSVSGSQVIVIDFAKKTYDFLKGNVRGPGQLRSPIGVALDKEGNLYVADTARNDIVVYDAEGNYLKSMGKTSSTEEKKSTTVGVAVYGDLVYVLDGRGSEIRVLDRTSGEQLRTVGSLRTEADPQNAVAFPTSMTVDPQGFIYVSSLAKSNVMKFDSDGHLIFQFGGATDTPGGFSRPKGIAVDDDGWIYVADAGFSNVQIFMNDRKGMLGVFGTPGLPAGSLNLPTGIAVSKDNLPYFQKLAAPGFILEKIVFVSNQSASLINSTISIYGIGAMQGSKKGGSEKK